MTTSPSTVTASTPEVTKRRISTKTPKTVAKSTLAALVPKVIAVSKPVVNEPDMRKKELIDLAVARSGIKKKYAKPTVEAVLEILGEAISDGRELNLQPFGKLRINRMEEKSNGRVIICKLRQSTVTKPKSNVPETLTSRES
jgi:nucleoid DNA-binding protein